MIKRFNPDFSLSISHELAYMRETPEGGYVAHGDYATLFSELELVKADRDALERQLLMSEAKCKGYFSDAAAALVKCDALAVENAELKLKAAELVQEASTVYAAYNATIREPDGDSADFQTLHEMHCVIETPATSAALAAIEARGVDQLIERKLKQLANMHPDTHAFGATAMSLRAQINELQAFAIELREAK
ncbi:hypothetical protein AB4M04_01545 [Serratia quinivorans]|uniref:Uncharacterized protein n=1 Tax=Serratia quinivorans TaxID=137545 RepID=A0ABV3UCY5_9GAMM